MLELLAPLCLVHRRVRYVWLIVMAGFHFSTVALMGIFFWESLLLFPVLLLDGDVMLGWFDRLINRSSEDNPQHAVAPADGLQDALAVGA